ncbi:FKBP-type peptidyl-prolyl cis-trans isomerase [Maribacter sp. 2307ULW6-5]|uniref:FKBP-type peptidyl-prolyl cis-trans isomerase n=1 Tax=Maribacter sp. 2307ULW6-5 TaxID=3386275 RepID=UPI0039BCF22C
MKMERIFFLAILFLSLWACGDDDEGPPGEVVPPRLLSEVAAEDDAEIVAFLKSHFYNYEEFENPPPEFDFQVRFDTIAGENSGKQAIFDSPNLIKETINVPSSIFGRNDGEEVDHTLYVLVAQQGAVADSMPTIGDNAIIQYKGTLLDGTVFDAVTGQPIRFNLSQVVPGFGNGLEYFQKGTGPNEVGDGTISYEEFGSGAIFIPSGLAYFASPQAGSGIPIYAPLIFKVQLLDYEPNTDTDNDGIPSIQEDVNNNGNLNDDNTDVQFENPRARLPNFRDPDDDGDGIPTAEEILIDGEVQKDANGMVIFPDTDGDGTPDHLDDDL